MVALDSRPECAKTRASDAKAPRAAGQEAGIRIAALRAPLVDCGGASCGLCALGDHCNANADCISASCQGGVCKQHPCANGVLDATESDVDCGGGVCAPCSDGDMCKVAAECVSAICSSGTCGLPLCGNGVQDQDESDVDCGGTSCRA